MLYNSDRREILIKVHKGELTAEAGLRSLKGIAGRNPENSVYYTAAWETQPVSVPGKSSGGANILLFAGEKKSAGVLKNALEKKAGCRVILILSGTGYHRQKDDVFTIDPAQPGDYTLFFNQLRTEGKECFHIIHYWSTTPFKETEADVQEQLQLGIQSVFRITRALMEQKVKQEVAFLYCYANKEGPEHPLFAAVSGFARTVHLENPRYRFKVIGIDPHTKPDAGLAGSLLEEFSAEKESTEISYRNQQRYVRRFVETDNPGPVPLNLKAGGTYVLAGGAGGLGLIIADFIASRVRCNLALTGRSGLSLHKQQRMEAIRQSGAVVEYFQGDIAEQEEARELLLNIKKRFGKIDGIINSAGINQDAFLIRKTEQEMAAVIRPKVSGTLNLDLLTRQESLDFFILFSSITGVMGNAGQADYAYANSFLDYFAFYREQLRAQGSCYGKTLSINWPLWEAGGMQVDDASREQLKRTMGMDPLKTEEGRRAFELILHMNYAQVGVVTGERAAILKWLKIAAASSPKTTFTDKPAPGRKVSQKDVEEQLLAICSDLLKVDPADINRETELVEYGVGSIMMISLLNRIEKLYGDTIAPNAISDYPTINKLAEHLIESGIVKMGEEDREVPSLPPDAIGDESRVEESRFFPGNSGNTINKPRFMLQDDHQAVLFSDKRHRQDNKVAVISMACRLPQSASPGEFWEHLKNGRDLIRETPPDRWNVKQFYAPDSKGTRTSYSKWAGYVDDIDLFDAAFFGIPDDSALILDPQHRIILELAQELIDRAGYTKKELDDSRTSVYIGANESAYIYRYWDQISGPDLKHVVVNRIQNMMAARVSDFYNLRGPSLIIDTACSSSLVAVHEACRSIMEQEVDMAIVGGIDLIIGEYYHIGFSQSGALSREPKSYVFDERAGGFVLGEGAGMVLLKDYARAVEDGDPIIAVILGSAVNNDGHTMGLTVPDLDGQQDVIKRALEASGINPETITLYEAHGTGTLLGDPIEIKAASTVYREYTSKLNYCAVGSVKTNIGHLLRAAGIAGLLKILLSLQNRAMPATLNCERPHPRFKFDSSPFYPNTSLQPWNPADGIRRAAISSFGFGGTNAHVILEGFENPPPQYTLKHPPLPVTRFNRKRYWIGKPIEFVGKKETGQQDLQSMLERLSRGELTVEEMLALENTD